MNFFVKYRLQINVLFLFFWIFIIYNNYTSGEFKLIKITPAILFIILAIYNIYKSLNTEKPKSED